MVEKPKCTHTISQLSHDSTIEVRYSAVVDLSPEKAKDGMVLMGLLSRSLHVERWNE
jgi:hypothetical protein